MRRTGSTPHSALRAPPCIWTFLSSLGDNRFFSILLGEAPVLPNYPILDSDILVIGAGGAGCSAAIAAADAGARVTLLDKGRLGLSGSTFDPFTWGKGITVAARGFNPSDDPEVHYRLAIEAARRLANPTLVRIVA